MSSININQLVQSIETSIASLAKDTLQQYLSAAKSDGQGIIDNLKGDLQQWSAEVSNGDLAIEDLQYLVAEQGALTEMTALKEAGLAAVRIDTFKTGVVNIITGAVAGLVKV